MKFTTKIGCLATVLGALHAPLAMATPKPAPKPVPASLSFSDGENERLSGVQGTFNPTRYGGIDAYSSTYDLTHMQKGGTLKLNGTGTMNLSFTFVGKEAAYNDTFEAWKKSFSVDGHLLADNNVAGSSFQLTGVKAGTINFGFKSDNKGELFSDGNAATGLILARDTKSALILFNDKGNDKDYDDMVIKVSLFTVPVVIASVPEPEPYTLMLAGLGIMGFVARRRKNAQS